MGSYIASGDTDGAIHVWNAQSGETLVVYRGHRRFVRGLAWSPDGRYIASGGDYGDSTFQIWEALTGTRLASHVDQYRVFAVSWSPAGDYIASASFDGTVMLRDAHADSPG